MHGASPTGEDQLKPRLSKPSPALVIACLALVMSMAGTGYAAAKINGKNIKKGTVSGTALKKNTLGGTQIKESKLGTVPKAANADNAASAANAANAAALQGTPAAGFARSANFVRVIASANVGDPDQTLVTHGDISVKFRCSNNGGNDILQLIATTTTDGAVLESEEDSIEPLNTDTAASSSELINDSTAENTFDAEDGYDDTGFIMNAASDKVITLLEGSKTVVFNRAGKDCTVGAVFIVN